MIAHKGATYRGQHEAIVDKETWEAVQAKLTANTQGRRTRSNVKQPSLLAGLVFDESGARLAATHAVKNGRRYRFYATPPARPGSKVATGGAPLATRISASGIEPLVIQQVAGLLGDPTALMDRLGLHDLAPAALAHAFERARALATEIADAPGPRQRELLVELVERVVVGAASLRIALKRPALIARIFGDEPETSGDRDEPLVLEAPLRVARRGVETRLVVDGASAGVGDAPDRALVKALARGHAWFDDLVSGRARSIREIATREGVPDRYVSRLLEIAFLPPSLVEDILDGRQPVEMTAEKLCRAERPLLWAQDAGRGV